MNINQLRTALKAYSKGYKVAVATEEEDELGSLDYKVLLYFPVDEETGAYLVVTGYFNPSGDVSIKNFMSDLVAILKFRTEQSHNDY